MHIGTPMLKLENICVVRAEKFKYYDWIAFFFWVIMTYIYGYNWATTLPLGTPLTCKDWPFTIL